MRIRYALLAAATAAILTAVVEARPGDRLRERVAERRVDQSEGGALVGRGSAAQGATMLSYGQDKAQRVLVWPAKGDAGARPPLAVFIHGGGWRMGWPEMVDAKPKWFADHGWAFASIGYRLLPGAPVEEQARDIGRALAELRRQAPRLGYDPDRILLFGHSAGAHLTALVASDPTYAGASFAAIKGAVLIDGACYDVPAQIAANPFMAKRTYIPAFGTDPARQKALSPLSHAGRPDVGDWLLLYTTARADSREQSEELARALRVGGAHAEVAAVPTAARNQRTGHLEINRDFGTAAYAANAQVEAIMRRVAG